MSRHDIEVILAPFQRTSVLDFNEVIIGVTETKKISFRNDSDYQQELSLTGKKNTIFSVEITNVVIDPKTNWDLTVKWCPTVIGYVNEFLHLKTNTNVSIQVKLIGFGIDPKPLKKSNKNKVTIKKSFTIVQTKKDENDKENIKPIAAFNMDKKKSVGTKEKMQIDSPISNLCSPITCDEKWLIDQETGFVKWLNHIFAENETKTKIDDLRNNKLQYNEEMRELYREESTLRILNKLDIEINRDTVNFKPNCFFRISTSDHIDLLNYIMSYNNAWLLLVMETMFDREFLVALDASNVDQIVRGCVSNWILWNDQLGRKYKCEKGRLLHNERFDAELHRCILKRFFTLVYLLDIGKQSNILPIDINLFKKDSETKCSKDILNKFNRRFVKGEGSYLKRFESWGYNVTHTQSELDDYDFTVSNLSNEISDGVRLGKLAYIFLGVDVLNKLRLPASDNQRKIYNMCLVATAFKESGTELVTYSGDEINMIDVAKGHREKTLATLWCILSRYHIDSVINKEKMFLEIKKLDGKLNIDMSGKELLMMWMQLICKRYYCDVTCLSSLADGRALCFLINYYLPNCLKLSQIRHKTTKTTVLDDVNTEEILMINEQQNFQTFFQKLKEIGGAPIMIPENQIPNGDLIIATLAFFSSRLIDLMTYSKAASIIQRTWKHYRLRREFVSHYILHEREVIVVQTYIRRYLAVKVAKSRLHNVVLCQSAIRRYLAKKESLQIQFNIVLIQKCIRRYIRRQFFLKQKAATILIQCHFRRFVKQNQYEILRSSSITLQKHIRGYLCRKRLALMKQSAICIQKYIRKFIIEMKYVKLKKASITIQKIFRGYQARKECLQKRRAIVLLQSHVRSFIERRKFVDMKMAVIIIQSYVRKFQVEKKYKRIVSSCVNIQKNFRGYLVRKKVNRQRIAVETIERFFCGHLERKRFIEVKIAAICIQKYVRKTIARLSYLKLKASTEIIQAHVRGFIIKKNYLRMKKAIVIIQAQVRTFQCTIRYKKVYSSVIVLQKYTRGYLDRKYLAEKQDAAVTIQKYWRSYVCKKRFNLKKNSALLLQKHIRGYLQRQKYRHDIKSVIFIQSCVRKYIAQKQYADKRAATLKIQKTVRMWLPRKRFEKQKKSANVIQKYFRGFICRKNYNTLKKSAITIQKYVRGNIQQKKFNKEKKAAILVQKLYRGNKARKVLNCMRLSAIVIQKQFKCYLARQKFCRMKKAAIVIQSRFRGYITRKKYVSDIRQIICVQSIVRSYLAKKRFVIMKESCIMIQKTIRGFLGRQKYITQRRAVLSIQTVFRGYSERKRYLQMKGAAIVLQKNVRKAIKRHAYLKQRTAAINIQRVFRGYLLRKEIKHQYRCATTIQKYFRCYSMRKMFCQMKKASIIIQTRYRGYVAKQKYLSDVRKIVSVQSVVRGYLSKKRFLTMKESCIMIQKTIRGYLGRQKYITQRRAILRIQTVFRGYSERKRYLQMKCAAIVLQKNIRRFIEQTTYLKQRTAAINIQRLFRGYILRKEIKDQHRCATTIQKYFRRYSNRKRFCLMKQASIAIQSRYRGYVARQNYVSDVRKIICVQSIVRGYMAQKKFMLMKESCIIIQKTLKGFLARKKLSAQRSASIQIQKVFRGYIVKNEYLKLKCATIILQKNTRRLLQFRNYVKQKSAAITIQSIFRGFLVRNDLNRKHNAATIIARNYRSYKCFQSFRKQKCAARIIQCYWRMYSSRSLFLKMKKSAIIIQSSFRQFLCRRQYCNMIVASVTIQKNWRCFIAVQKFKNLTNAAIVFQKNFKSIIERRNFLRNKEIMSIRKQDNISKRYDSAVTIQAWFRGHCQRKKYIKAIEAIRNVQMRWKYIFKLKFQAVVMIQKYWRSHRRQRAALTIQRIWRGNKIREDLHKVPELGPEVHKIRKRFIDAQKRFSIVNTVRSIGVRSLCDLKKPNCSVARILSSLGSLEKVTSLSREICGWLVDSNAYNILVDLIHDCNRGVADLEVVSKSISVLFNLGKAAVLDLALIGPEMGAFLKDLLIRNFKAKKGTKGVTIFCHTCLLLVLLIKMERKSQHTYHYMISKDQTFVQSIMTLRKNLQSWSEHSIINNACPDYIYEQMKLIPSWNLARTVTTQKTRQSTLMKRASTMSLQESNKLNHVPLSKESQFKKPANLPKPTRSTASSKENVVPLADRTTKLSNQKPPHRPAKNLRRSISVSSLESRTTNIWDDSYKLYAINQLCNSLDV